MAANADLPVWVQKLIDGAVSCGLTLLQAVLTAVIGLYIIKLIVRWVRTLLKKTSMDDNIK